MRITVSISGKFLWTVSQKLTHFSVNHTRSERQKSFYICSALSSGMYCRVKWLSETSVDNHFTRQYITEDNSECHIRRRENLKSHIILYVFMSTFLTFHLLIGVVLVASGIVTSSYCESTNDQCMLVHFNSLYLVVHNYEVLIYSRLLLINVPIKIKVEVNLLWTLVWPREIWWNLCELLLMQL
jgi:predicted anti-sigma-YlaC factor YlaD